MARAALLALLCCGCGLAAKDYDVTQAFQAGGGAPPFGQDFASETIVGQLSADVSRISTITLKAARIDAVDAPESGDVSFVSGATITVSAAGQSTATIATLPSPAAAGARSVSLQTTAVELKPYLQSGGGVRVTISYSPTPVTARSLQLVLTLHGSVL